LNQPAPSSVGRTKTLTIASALTRETFSMNYARTLRVLASLALVGVLGAGGAGCTATATAGPTCGIDDTVPCSQGQGFSCTGGDQPEDSDPSLVCSYGVSGNAGSVLYCCLHAAPNTTCGPDSTVNGCAPGSFGFSCSDATEPPSASYPQLSCSSPIQGNAGAALYCCKD
jgi:hypothetical protein